MRYLYVTFATMLLGGLTALAQQPDYLPLVREGVVWHYNHIYEDQPAEHACTMFFWGDSVVNGVIYKKCIKVHNDNNDEVAALMREKDRIVYSIGGDSGGVPRAGEHDGEIILYDFSEPSTMFTDNFDLSNFSQTTATVAGTSCNSYSCDGFNSIVEGIGIDGSGTLEDIIFGVLTSTHYQYTGLAYVEQNGQIIYKGKAYEQPDYLPLVREGVRWVNNGMLVDDFDTLIIKQEYTYVYEFVSDTTILTATGTHEYKVIQSMPPILMREADKVVYIIEEESLLAGQPREYVLYDFSDPTQATLHGAFGEFRIYELIGTTDISGHPCRVFSNSENYFSSGLLIESIGLVTQYHGDMTMPKWYWTSGNDKLWGLDHVEDSDGNIIYRTPWCEHPLSGLAVVGDERRCNDHRWYNLLGQPSDQAPTKPGIYIHRGRKVVIR